LTRPHFIGRGKVGLRENIRSIVADTLRILALGNLPYRTLSETPINQCPKVSFQHVFLEV
jgi:hypothetical protein